MITDKLLQELLPTPVALLSFKDEGSLNKINSLLPYSMGFEIECDQSSSYSTVAFKSIPDIIEVNSSTSEQRYRIPNGLRGILCLYHICDQLRTNCMLNYGSGIHYHVDCTDCWDTIRKRLNYEQSIAILEELDTWGYRGEYNKRGFSSTVASTPVSVPKGSWVRFNDLRTMEFRIGEMTFDYNLILKRMMHCSQLVKVLKDECPDAIPTTYKEIDFNAILNYSVEFSSKTYGILQKILELKNDIAKEEEKEEKESKTPFEVFKEGIKGRLHKLY